MPVDIQHLLQQIADGQRDAFAPLVRHYQRPLFGYLGRMGLAQAQAEDIAQDTFLRAWTNLASYDPQRAAFSTWLFTIARRLALNVLAKDAPNTASTTGDERATERAGPLEQLATSEQHRQLQHALRRLPLPERSALALAYIQGLDRKSIARIEGCSENAIKVRLHRAREKLRHWLGEQHEDH